MQFCTLINFLVFPVFYHELRVGGQWSSILRLDIVFYGSSPGRGGDNFILYRAFTGRGSVSCGYGGIITA